VADDILHRESHVDQIAVAGDVDLFEVGKQCRTSYQGAWSDLVTTLSPCQRGTSGWWRHLYVQTRGEGVEFVADRLEFLFVPADQVHLLTASTMCWMPSSDARKACRRDCSSRPWRASTSTITS